MFGLFKKSNIGSINVREIDSLIGNINLIDVREKYEFKARSLKTAKNIPLGTLISRPNNFLKKENKYYLICQSGARSKRASKALAKEGYDVVNVAGGMMSYSGKNKK